MFHTSIVKNRGVKNFLSKGRSFLISRKRHCYRRVTAQVTLVSPSQLNVNGKEKLVKQLPKAKVKTSNRLCDLTDSTTMDMSMPMMYFDNNGVLTTHATNGIHTNFLFIIPLLSLAGQHVCDYVGKGKLLDTCVKDMRHKIERQSLTCTGLIEAINVKKLSPVFSCAYLLGVGVRASRRCCINERSG